MNVSIWMLLEHRGARTGYMKLGSDGHLRVYNWIGSSWSEKADLLTASVGNCGYPTVCGNYSICGNGQCACPQTAVGRTNFLQQINYWQPDQGCFVVTPISRGYFIFFWSLRTAYIPHYCNMVPTKQSWKIAKDHA